jgi:hypothetical protein
LFCDGFDEHSFEHMYPHNLNEEIWECLRFSQKFQFAKIYYRTTDFVHIHDALWLTKYCIGSEYVQFMMTTEHDSWGGGGGVGTPVR